MPRARGNPAPRVHGAPLIMVLIVVKTHPVAGSVLPFPVRVSRERRSVIQVAKPRASLKQMAVRTVLSEARQNLGLC